MNVGELFVSLGVKGTDKTIGAFKQVTSGLEGVSEVSLEAKAAILGVMYAFDRLIQNAGATGSRITNLTTLIQMNKQVLQQYEYAARVFANSTEQEMDQVFLHLMQMSEKIRTHQAKPNWFGEFAAALGKQGFDVNKMVQEWAGGKNLDQLFQLIIKYANSVSGVARGHAIELIKSLTGASDNTVAGMLQGAFKEQNLAKADTLSNSQVKELDTMRQQLSGIAKNLETDLNKIAAAHGPQIVESFKAMATAVLLFAESFEKLDEKVNIVGRFAMMLAGVANSMKVITELMDYMNGKPFKPGDLLYKAEPSKHDKETAAIREKDQALTSEDFENLTGISAIKAVLGAIGSTPTSHFPSIPVAPKVAPAQPQTTPVPVSNSTTVNQTNTFNNAGGITPAQVSAATEKGVKAGQQSQNNHAVSGSSAATQSH